MFGVKKKDLQYWNNRLSLLVKDTKERLSTRLERTEKLYAENEKELQELKKEIEKLNFKVENPAKYKVGSTYDKVWVVTEVSIEESNWISAKGGLFCGMGTVHDSLLKTEPKFYWRYKVVNKQTGETKTV